MVQGGARGRDAHGLRMNALLELEIRNGGAAHKNREAPRIFMGRCLWGKRESLAANDKDFSLRSK